MDRILYASHRKPAPALQRTAAARLRAIRGPCLSLCFLRLGFELRAIVDRELRARGDVRGRDKSEVGLVQLGDCVPDDGIDL